MLSNIRNVDYTVIFCREIEPMKQFYRDVMGFNLARDFGTWVEFQVGSAVLALNTRGAGYEGVAEHHGAAPDHGAGLQLAFRVAPSDVAGCYEELQRKGVPILQAPADQVTGHRTLFLRDPEHNILEIYAEL